MRMFSRICLFLFVVLIISSSQAEPLRLGSSYVVSTYFPKVEPAVNEAFRRIGQSIEIFDLPNERSNVMQANEIIDGQMFRYAGYGADVPNLIQVNVSLGQLKVVVVVHEDSDLTHFKQLQGRTMAYELGVKLQKQAMEKLNAIPAIVDSLEICAKMVEYQRTDFTVLSDKIAETFIKSGYKIKVLGEPLDVSDNYLWLHENYADLIPDLERELKEMKADGWF